MKLTTNELALLVFIVNVGEYRLITLYDAEIGNSLFQHGLVLITQHTRYATPTNKGIEHINRCLELTI